MPSDRPELIQYPSALAGSLEQIFRTGSAACPLPWQGTPAEISGALSTVERYLGTLPVEASFFQGTDGFTAERQSLWVASTGLGRRLHTEANQIAHLDGDAAGGTRGI